MYTLALQREFIARHFLIGGDWGRENQLHAHHYRLEAVLEAGTLDEHEYLVDLVELEASLELLIDTYREATLNDRPEFEGRNPSLERFARVLWEKLATGLRGSQIDALTVRLWESDTAWAAYRSEL